jgi:hypothetical protein
MEFEPVEIPEASDLGIDLPDHPGSIEQIEREAPPAN